jgi:hypothetical protein
MGFMVCFGLNSFKVCYLVLGSSFSLGLSQTRSKPDKMLLVNFRVRN